MHLQFYKYHGAGNDFIIADNRTGVLSDIFSEQVRQMCSRRFGVGSDGFILLSSHTYADFQMDFYNPDGSGATFCGNGARCIVAFAYRLGIIGDETEFKAADGLHKAVIKKVNSEGSDFIIRLKMNDVADVRNLSGDYFCHTGSPHLVKYAEDIENFPVSERGREIRFSQNYKSEGTNVNFIRETAPNEISVRTYERGVENETLSCGTGVTASALAHAKNKGMDKGSLSVNTRGGQFQVSFSINGTGFNGIYLQGPAAFVFEGDYKYSNQS